MRSTLYSLAEATAKIKTGAPLLLAGDESLLKKLPPGPWIGGTIPYFMTVESGGVFSRDRVFITELPPSTENVRIVVLEDRHLREIYQQMPDNGFGFIIMPGSSKTQLHFALNAPRYPAFGVRPLVGWVSGIDLAESGKTKPKVVDGQSGRIFEEGAVVMYVSLPITKVANVGIHNIFRAGTGDDLTFEAEGFSAGEVLVNGRKQNFGRYLKENKINTKLPLVTNLNGVNLNVAFAGVDGKTGVASFYAPVFKGLTYRHAVLEGDYVDRFLSDFPVDLGGSVCFSCNCICNYLHSNLQGRKMGALAGPITFGEVAYQLLNQTMVYLSITDAVKI